MVKPKNHLTLRDIALTSRPFWWITTAAPYFVGFLIGGVHISTMLMVGTLYFLFPYNLMLYGVNDIYDYESDILNPRKAGIEGAVLAKEKHRSLWIVILATNIPFWLYFIYSGNRAATIWLFVMIFMAFAYSMKGLRYKEIPILDSFTSSFHYTSPFLFGVFYSHATYLWLPAYVIFFIWAMANHALGAIQDIKPDREAHIESIATKLGSAQTTTFCLACYSLAALLPTLLYGLHGVAISIVLLAYVVLVWRTWGYRNKDTNPIFHRSWQYLTYMNYVCGFLVSIILIILYKTS